MRPLIPALWLGCLWATAAAHAESALPTCSGLVAALKQSPMTVRNGLPLLTVDAIVEDLKSTPDSRVCTGVAHYPDGAQHVTFLGRWKDERQTSYTVEGHETIKYEEAARALSLRVKTHPNGTDGTFAVRAYLPYCTDAEFIRIATNELRQGISFRGLFFKEPTYKIVSIDANGYGSGILANCVATVGDAEQHGQIFLGTDWVNGEAERRFQFYILESGPDGWKLKNRLWEFGTE
jgi:hypothetical protein